MISTRMSLPRRTVLRGAGATLALPLLDAMAPAFPARSSAAAAPVKRLGVIYVPNGIAMGYWTPPTTGPGFELTPILNPLAPFHDRVLVISGLDGPGGAAHTGASTEFLTGMKPEQPRAELSGPRAGVSIDQLLAKEFGRDTQLASLEMGLDAKVGTGTCDGFSCALTNTISWRSPTALLPMENDPRAVFERMFGDSGSTDAAARLARIQRDRSILDSVMETVARLKRDLGQGDNTRVSEYLDSVRDLERRIQKAEQQSARELPSVTKPAGVPATFEEHAKLMFDLQVLAYQSDLTRVITFMIGREYSGRAYPELGIPEAHHPLSHHKNDPEMLANIAKLNTFHMTMFAYYLDKLRSTPDGDGSLLDHLLLLYGGGMSDSNIHLHKNLPMLMVGGPSLMKGGRHIRRPGEKSADLLMTIMEKMGVPVPEVGEGRRALDIDSDGSSGPA